MSGDDGSCVSTKGQPPLKSFQPETGTQTSTQPPRISFPISKSVIACKFPMEWKFPEINSPSRFPVIASSKPKIITCISPAALLWMISRWHVFCATSHLGAVVVMRIRCRRCWCWRDTSGVLSIAGWIRSEGPSCRNCRSFTKSKLESLRATIFCMSGQAKNLANVTIASNFDCLPS